MEPSEYFVLQKYSLDNFWCNYVVLDSSKFTLVSIFGPNSYLRPFAVLFTGMKFGFGLKNQKSMKTTFYILVIILLCSCSSINKILTIEDPFKEETNIKLLQVLDGYSDERKSFIRNKDYYFPVKTVYTQSNNGLAFVLFELKLTTSARTEELDSTIYMQIDDVKFKLNSTDYAMRNYVSSSSSTSTETKTSTEKDSEDKEDKKENLVTSTTTTTTTTEQTLQAMKHTFEIPKEMWEKIAFCNDIMIRSYIDNEGVNVKFGHTEQKQFSRFFKEVLKKEFTDKEITVL